MICVSALVSFHHLSHAWSLKEASLNPIPALLDFVLSSFHLVLWYSLSFGLELMVVKLWVWYRSVLHLVIDRLADQGERFLHVLPSFGGSFKKRDSMVISQGLKANILSSSSVLLELCNSTCAVSFGTSLSVLARSFLHPTMRKVAWWGSMCLFASISQTGMCL